MVQTYEPQRAQRQNLCLRLYRKKISKMVGLMNKALRIQRTERKHKQRYKKYLPTNSEGRNLKVMLETPKCIQNCICCCNKRKRLKGKHRITIQERKILDNSKID